MQCFAEPTWLCLQEICLLRVLSYDPNMVQFYGACLDPGFPMLVLEYMEGGDLQSCIQQDCYPTPQGQFTWYSKGAQIALDVAKGIVFLHEQKVSPHSDKTMSTLHAVSLLMFGDAASLHR